MSARLVWREAGVDGASDRDNLGPNYIGTTRDRQMKPTKSLATMSDGTSITAAFGEWVKGPGLNGPPLAKNGHGILYYLIVGGSRADSAAFPTDYQFVQACAASPNTSANQAWSWKCEWRSFGGTMTYSHTNMPNRTACQYNDQNTGRRAHHHPGQRQFEPPRWS